jgi:pyruvate dehydrogenase E1 component alpha subunit
VDGNDVVAVCEAASDARDRALAGEGPTLIECKTYRHRGHSSFDMRLYRPREEIDAWLTRDPLVLSERTLREKGLLDDELVERIEAAVREQVDEAEEFALTSPEPSPEAGMEFIFCPSEVGSR